jgi:hypothetical protein
MAIPATPTTTAPTFEMPDLSWLNQFGTQNVSTSGWYGQQAGLTQMPNAPTAPGLPALPNIGVNMPGLPELQGVARMPNEGDAAIQAARKRAADSIAQRAGRKSTFLTTTTRASAPPPTVAQKATPFAARTYG